MIQIIKPEKYSEQEALELVLEIYKDKGEEVKQMDGYLAVCGRVAVLIEVDERNTKFTLIG